MFAPLYLLVDYVFQNFFHHWRKRHMLCTSIHQFFIKSLNLIKSSLFDQTFCKALFNLSYFTAM